MGRRKERSGSVLWLTPAVMWVAVLFYFSGQDGGQSSALSAALAEKLLPARFGNILLSVFIGGGLAVLNELHQLASEGRVCSAADMAIDASGVLVGALVAAAIENIAWAYVHRRRRRFSEEP